MGAFEFSTPPKLMVSEDGRTKVFQMSFSDSDRMIRICELVSQSQADGVIWMESYKLIQEAAKLLKGAHE
jgi:hypothetical protein